MSLLSVSDQLWLRAWGSITSVQAIYMHADDLTYPDLATTFAHLDATIVLSLQVDYEMALEYATQSRVSEEPRESTFLQSLEVEDYYIDLHNPIFVFRLFC